VMLMLSTMVPVISVMLLIMLPVILMLPLAMFVMLVPTGPLGVMMFCVPLVPAFCRELFRHVLDQSPLRRLEYHPLRLSHCSNLMHRMSMHMGTMLPQPGPPSQLMGVALASHRSHCAWRRGTPGASP
jgi:hypothetical protein